MKLNNMFKITLNIVASIIFSINNILGKLPPIASNYVE
jgi:hypothetical protein